MVTHLSLESWQDVDQLLCHCCDNLNEVVTTVREEMFGTKDGGTSVTLANCAPFSLPATILSCGWIIYLTYYNSRNIGLILTLIINRLCKNGYIHIGECK